MLPLPSNAQMPTPNLDAYKGKVLIVDDLPDNLRLLTDFFSAKKYYVQSVLNGEVAIQLAIETHPDVILLDIRMPRMNGYDVCEILQNHPDTCEIPIIFISAMSNSEDKVKAFRMGGADYITKPFQFDEVLARVENQLTLRRQQQQLQQEIAKRAETEEILYQSRALLSSILNSSLDGIAAMQAIRDPATSMVQDFRCLAINPVLAQMFNCQRHELIGEQVLQCLLNRLGLPSIDPLVEVIDSGVPLEQDICITKGDRPCWYHFIIVKLGDGFSVTVQDITSRKIIELELESANAILRDLAHLDGLTQVANRRCFDQQLQQEWRRLTREQQPLSLILFDVDYFKLYNDRYGHQQGDDCLIQIAQAAKQLIKRPADLLARYGGEEFAVILSSTDLAGAEQVARSIHAAVRSLDLPHESSPVTPTVTISLGIACIVPSTFGSLEELIQLADRALYTAKQQGRDRYCLGPL